VEVECRTESLRIPVFDRRSRGDRANTFPSEVDQDLLQRILDELLFEQYGGRLDPEVLEDERPEGKQEDGLGDSEDQSSAIRRDSYAVPSITRAREHWRVVDCWAARLDALSKSGKRDFEWDALCRDGGSLAEAFRRQGERERKNAPAAAIGANLATEEMALRLKLHEEPQ
jgi:hypothetical protein